MGILDRIEEDRNARIEGRTKTFDLPTGIPYQLVIQSQPQPWFKDLEKKMKGRSEDDTAAYVLAATCERVLIDGKPPARWLLDEADDQERDVILARLNGRDPDERTDLHGLAVVLGKDDLDSAAAVIRWLLPPDRDIGLTKMSQDVMGWLVSARDAASEDVLGE